MKPEDKAKYLVNEFGKEKAMDVCLTMLDAAIGLDSPANIVFWGKVKYVLKTRNHKWDENNKCIYCGLEREMQTGKLLMAIDHGRDYYKYERKYAYSFDLKKWTFKRPECKRRIK